MTNILKWISLSFLGYRVYSLYAGKAAKVMDWDYVINSVGLTKYSAKFIEGFVDWEFINSSDLVGQVRDIDVDFLYKGSVIGSINMPGPYLVPAKGTATCSYKLSPGAGSSIRKGAARYFRTSAVWRY